MQGKEPEPAEIEIIEPEPATEPVDPVKVWAERQKAIPIPKAKWFSVEKDLGPVTSESLRIEDIIKAVATHYGVSRNDILSHRRTANVVRPRQVGYYLAKVLTLKSLPEIGRRFGGRDHTSALSGIRKIERLRQTDTCLEMDLRVIAATLGGSLAA
jgi:chromosomal replication initiation ATPase DnaA